MEIFVGISEVLVGIPGLVWPLEALKREQASQVTQLPDIILPLTATGGQLTPGRCSHNSGHTITVIGVQSAESRQHKTSAG